MATVPELALLDRSIAVLRWRSDHLPRNPQALKRFPRRPPAPASVPGPLSKSLPSSRSPMLCRSQSSPVSTASGKRRTQALVVLMRDLCAAQRVTPTACAPPGHLQEPGPPSPPLKSVLPANRSALGQAHVGHRLRGQLSATPVENAFPPMSVSHPHGPQIAMPCSLG